MQVGTFRLITGYCHRALEYTLAEPTSSDGCLLKILTVFLGNIKKENKDPGVPWFILNKETISYVVMC